MRVKLVIVLLFVALIPVTMGIREVKANPSGLTHHAPILIDGPSGFTSSNGVTSGTGTSSDPFMIQGWSIDASAANGIEIRNLFNAFETPVFFVIRNVFIHSEANSFADIAIDTVQDSQDCFECSNNIFNGLITNSTLVGNGQGIVLSNSANVEVTRVTIKDTGTGIDCVNDSRFLQQK